MTSADLPVLPAGFVALSGPGRAQIDALLLTARRVMRPARPRPIHTDAN